MTAVTAAASFSLSSSPSAPSPSGLLVALSPSGLLVEAPAPGSDMRTAGVCLLEDAAPEQRHSFAPMVPKAEALLSAHEMLYGYMVSCHGSKDNVANAHKQRH